MTVPFTLALLLSTVSSAAVCQPEPRETAGREVVWNEHLSRLSVLARHLPATPDARLLIPIAGVQMNQVADTWGSPRGSLLKHVGQDIFAKRGTPVRSATDGIVWMIGNSVQGGT